MSWGLRPRPEPREITREEVETFERDRERDRLLYATARALAAGRTGFSGELPTQKDVDDAEELLAWSATHPSKSRREPADEAPSSDAP